MSIRNLGYIAWKNDLSWLEEQKGPKWEALIKSENNKFTHALKKVEVISMTESRGTPEIYEGWSIESDSFSPNKKWTHLKSGFQRICWSVDLSEDMIAFAIQDEKGFERFSVEVYKVKSSCDPIHLKTFYKTGPTVTFLDHTLYFLGSEKDLRYSQLKSWSPSSDETIIYTCKDLKENLELKKGEDDSVYLLQSDFVKTSFAMLPSLLWSDEPHLSSCIVNDTLRLPEIEDTIEALSFKAGWLITRSNGIRTLWKMDKEMKPVIWVWGDIEYVIRDPFRLHVYDIRYDSYTICLPSWKLNNPKPHLYPCSYHEHPLPAFVVHPKEFLKVKGILITAYGAYGTPTHVGSLISRWKPLLKKGWIVASVMVPGSGDDGPSWKLSGQRTNRIQSIHALEESIRALQEEYGIDGSRTALYGRSAGGLLVSSVAIMNPGLIGALYLESPYVDVLRTITNPDLPLTTLETSEFGSHKNSTNILATASWSPMEHIPREGFPELFVLARSDRADLEVFPYEVLKFMIRLKGKESLIYIHEGLGHFTTSWKTRGEDLALLDNWIDSPDKTPVMRKKNISSKYKTMATRRNRNRKNRSNRNRKNRNNVTMGGRRRHHKK